MKIYEFAKEVHQNAVEHGWWDEPRTGITPAYAGKSCH